MELLSPAKINWLLAVTGKRTDDFHELYSLVCPVWFGDTLSIDLSSEKESRLSIANAPTLACDRQNLILQAEEKFTQSTGCKERFTFQLAKKIPMGAGLGGGSSNAVTALLGMNELCGNPLGTESLYKIAAELGSDCPLFLEKRACVMKGRGEIIEPASHALREALASQHILIWKPEFSVPTPWAYQSLARAGQYDELSTVTARLTAFLKGDAPLTSLLHNTFERVIFEKFVGLRHVVEQLREEMEIPTLLSGSGSACFSLVPPEREEEISQFIKKYFGAQSVLAYTSAFC